MQIIFRVKGREEFDDEWMMFQTLHNFQLTKDLLVATLLLHDKLFAHCLDCIERSCVLFACQVDFLGESTFANDFNLIKILHGHHMGVYSSLLLECCHCQVTILDFVLLFHLL